MPHRKKSDLSAVTKGARRARKKRARETDEERSERLARIRERKRLKYLEKKASNSAWFRHGRVDEALKPVEWQSRAARQQERRIETKERDNHRYSSHTIKVNTMEAKNLTQPKNSLKTNKNMVSAKDMRQNGIAPVQVIYVKQIGTLSDNLETDKESDIELCYEQDVLNRVKAKMEMEKVWLDSIKSKLNAEPRLSSRFIKYLKDLGLECKDHGPWMYM